MTLLLDARHVRRRRSRLLLAPVAIAFSLTFVLASVAVYAGWVPAGTVPGGTDTATLLLLVPLAALMLAIIAEVIRHEVGAAEPQPEPRRTAAAAWRPGDREG
ncbi:MAG TPA: hypothetical protein VFO41_07445 [Alphaproteobacteria bacterium]|nr:hypothetical protein [Alphaproteobacteria bacterium]